MQAEQLDRMPESVPHITLAEQVFSEHELGSYRAEAAADFATVQSKIETYLKLSHIRPKQYIELVRWCGFEGNKPDLNAVAPNAPQRPGVFTSAETYVNWHVEQMAFKQERHRLHNRLNETDRELGQVKEDLRALMLADVWYKVGAKVVARILGPDGYSTITTQSWDPDEDIAATTAHLKEIDF